MGFAELKNPTPFEVGLRDEVRSAPHADELAWNAFAANGLPHRRLEGWKWTDLRTAAANTAETPNAIDASTASLPPAFAAGDIEASAIVTITDGKIDVAREANEQSLSVRVFENDFTPIADHAISDLNRALSPAVARINVTGDIEKPIIVRHRAGTGRNGGRIDVHIGENASATLIELIESGDGAFHHMGARFTVEKEGALTRSILQNADAGAVAVGLSAVTLSEKATLKQASIGFGGKLIRLETQVNAVGSEVNVSMDSVAMLEDARHADFSTIVRHECPGVVTRQRHKGVADQKAKAIFQGKFFVARDGQQTDADMQAKALLLSDHAQANHKPELEIYADDVECAHGSTCGALDEDALFYMRQRGLDDATARALLIEAFVGEVIDDMDGAGADLARSMLDQWLSGRLG
ncbi:MAG: SufD family Fe-S cluster assembly protein [Pseudomonadota bacterium]